MTPLQRFSARIALAALRRAFPELRDDLGGTAIDLWCLNRRGEPVVSGRRDRETPPAADTSSRSITGLLLRVQTPGPRSLPGPSGRRAEPAAQQPLVYPPSILKLLAVRDLAARSAWHAGEVQVVKGVPHWRPRWAGVIRKANEEFVEACTRARLPVLADPVSRYLQKERRNPLKRLKSGLVVAGQWFARLFHSPKPAASPQERP